MIQFIKRKYVYIQNLIFFLSNFTPIWPFCFNHIFYFIVKFKLNYPLIFDKNYRNTDALQNNIISEIK